MKDFEEFFKKLEEQLKGLDDKLQSKMDEIDKLIEDKVSGSLDKLKKKWGKSTVVVNDWDSDDFMSDDAETAHTTGANDNSATPLDKQIEKIAPYLDEETLYETTKQFVDGEIDFDVRKILVYLDDDSVSLLMNKLYESDGEEYKGLKVADILPYADEDDIAKIFKKKLKQGVIDKQLLSYVDSDDCLHEVVVEYCKNEDSTLNIDEIYPFLEEEDLALLFKTYLKRQKKNK